MCECCFVLVDTDYENKIYYVEKQTFAALSEDAKKAKADYSSLQEDVLINGWQIIEREKEKSR